MSLLILKVYSSTEKDLRVSTDSLIKSIPFPMYKESPG